MSDLMKRETRGRLALAVGGIAGGVGALVLASLAASPLMALGLGAAILYGSWKLFQKPQSALMGMVGLAAGVLTVASGIPLVGGLAHLLLNLSGIGLLAGGIWTIVKVARGRRT